MMKSHMIQSRRNGIISFVLLHLLWLLLFIHLISCDPINVPDKILLNCGSSEVSSFNGENWIGDSGSNFLTPGYDKSSSTVLLSNMEDSVAPKVPYSTARVTHSPLTYSFPSSPGLKFIRLYFISSLYLKMKPSNKAYFSVKAGAYTLVSDFNPSGFAEELNLMVFTKDFLVNVKEDKLIITFTPSPSISNAFAFINGIQTFSVPHTIYFPGSKAPVPYLGHQKPFFINDEYALEMLYRVSIGTDTGRVASKNAFGTWLDDFNYLFGSQTGSILGVNYPLITMNDTAYTYNYSAPEELYSNARTMGSNGDANMKYNLTWSFPVDSGFNYLVRLHFCEISVEVTQPNQRVFKVYINNQTAEESMDVVVSAGAPFIPLHKDYVVMVPTESGRRKDLWISLHPNLESKPKYADAILNGIEIMKISDSNHSLAAMFQLRSEQRKKKVQHVIIVVSATLGTIFGLLFTFFIIIHRAGKKLKWITSHILPSNSNSSHKNIQPTVTSGLCHQFTLEEIRIATSNFSEDLVIGEGGFGKVYKGIMHHDGVTAVAVKRSNRRSGQGYKEFQNEINFFSFCHMNLVSLLGYCQEGNELILVYEYMVEGPLSDHLYKKRKQPLPWIQRIKICIGAARGLHYLHTSTRHPVIHRDVKSANILLDQNLVAKIADFGLCRTVPSLYDSHVSTEVKGTLGYLDPEYYKRRKLTQKSDVYSYGVVLFEVLCGRAAVNPVAVEEESEKVGLATWAMQCYKCGSIDELVDPHLAGNVRPQCLMAFVDLGIQCLADRSAERPTMGEVLNTLERILSLQDSLEEQEPNTTQFLQ